MQKYKVKWMQCIFFLVVSLLLGSCAKINMDLPAILPDPERKPASTDLVGESVAKPEQQQRLQINALPALNVAEWNEQDGSGRWQKMGMPDGLVSLRVDALPLNEFIHMALGETLKLSFSVDKAVATRTDPVTLHVSKAVKAKRFLGLIEQALAVYGVGLVMEGDAIRVVPDSALKKAPPGIVSSSGSLRLHKGKVMMILPLTYANPAEAMVFSQLFLQPEKGSFMNVIPRLNALLVIGMPERVAKFKKAVELLDRPSMEGKYATLVRPVYWKVEALIKHLQEGLASQGVKIAHSATEQGLRLIAMEEINAVMVISPNKTWTALLEKWVKQLDTVDSVDALDEGKQAFVYFVKQSRASKLGATLSEVLGSVGAGSKAVKNSGTKVGISTKPVISAANSIALKNESGLRVVVDEEHNALIFVGSARSYRVAYQLLKQLDRPAKQVLIEATVADISLDESTQLGVEWAFSNVDNSTASTGALSTIGGLGVGAGGLSYTLINAAGAVQARLNALASEGKAKILSSPRLLAKDNEQARIQVGTQIAVLSQEVASASGTTDTSTGLLRSFKYVDTGVILTFTPTVTEGGAVQMKITQEVSEAGISINNTPPIATRNVSTTLVAQSGQTIMIGGLITHNKGITKTKVPFLGDISFIGQLFSNETITNRSTEMIILITPHIISTASDADYLTDAFIKSLDW